YHTPAATSGIYTLSLHDALPILPRACEKAEKRWSSALACQTASRFWTLAVAMARRQYPLQNSERRCLGLILRATWLRLGTSGPRDRKSTRLNSSHVSISYAVFCL